MKKEIKFKTENYNFYSRAVGIVRKDNKYLILNVDNSPYYHIPGGHIEIGEDSLTAVKREINEELGYTVKEANLFCIQENFYEKKGVLQHGIEYYYVIDTLEELETVDREYEENDRGILKKLLIHWVDKNELKNIDLRPFTVKDLLIHDKVNSFTHIIQRD